MNFKDLKKRLITSSLTIIPLILLLVFCNTQLVKILILLVVCSLGGIGIWEYSKLAKITDKKYLSMICIIIGVSIIISFFISTTYNNYGLLPIMVLFVGVFIIFFYHFFHIDRANDYIPKSLFGICYLSIPLGLILKILYDHEEGRAWIVYIICVTKITDISAYFFGRICGYKKLAPNISPAKTIFGGICGFVFAILFSLLFFSIKYFEDHLQISFINIICLGAILGIIGQFGDLSESVIKRDAKIKDSNNLPGLGGFWIYWIRPYLRPYLHIFFFICIQIIR